jgi:uncharacterized membrane protein
MKISVRIEIIQLSLIAAMFAAAALSWPHVPDRLPIHWNLQGEADGFGGKFAGLLLLPSIAVGLYLLLLLLPRLDPGYRNYTNFATAYNVIRTSLVCFMSVIDAVILLVAWGYPVDVTSPIAIATGLLFAVLGNFMGKIRPNWFVGVRTPWTLSSKLSWTKTHRLAGWLFIGIGILIAMLGLVRTSWMLVLTVSISVIGLLALVAYSYWVYRNDPDRTSPAGTSPGID